LPHAERGVNLEPSEAVGWDGYLYPWTFSVHDFEPITGRIHQPPPSHQTFQGQNFASARSVRASSTSIRCGAHPLSPLESAVGGDGILPLGVRALRM
jgi:hypothetical protein